MSSVGPLPSAHVLDRPAATAGCRWETIQKHREELLELLRATGMGGFQEADFSVEAPVLRGGTRNVRRQLETPALRKTTR